MSNTELAGLILAVIGLVVGVLGAWEQISSIFQRFLPHTPPFGVRKTTIKVLISERQTEIIKLRTIRMFRKQTILHFPDAPSVLKQPDDYGEPPKIEDLYSLPGRAEIDPNGEVLVVLEEDEVFARFRDHTLVFGYTMSGSVTSLWVPPFIEVQPPVGSERLTIQVYFPPGWDIERDVKHRPIQPQIFVKNEDGTRSEVPKGLSEIAVPPRHDFKDGRGPIQWIRAVIRHPPGKGKKPIVLEWRWTESAVKPASLNS